MNCCKRVLDPFLLPKVQLRACSPVQRRQGGQMPVKLTALTKIRILCYQGKDSLV